tara:strand:- start:2520 stop:2954 length:435 start_codon:yes stop_codon:yes gene_type:complete
MASPHHEDATMDATPRSLEERVRVILDRHPSVHHDERVHAMLDLIAEAIDEVAAGTDALAHPLRHVTRRQGGCERILLAGHRMGKTALMKDGAPARPEVTLWHRLTQSIDAWNKRRLLRYASRGLGRKSGELIDLTAWKQGRDE